MARRIIIENRSNLIDEVALERVKAVIGMGRISAGGTQYCYFTTFRDGTAVSTDLNKKSDRFVVLNVKGHDVNLHVEDMDNA